MAVVDSAEMLVDHGPDRLRTEVTASERRCRENDVTEERP